MLQHQARDTLRRVLHKRFLATAGVAPVSLLSKYGMNVSINQELFSADKLGEAYSDDESESSLSSDSSSDDDNESTLLLRGKPILNYFIIATYIEYLLIDVAKSVRRARDAMPPLVRELASLFVPVSLKANTSAPAHDIGSGRWLMFVASGAVCVKTYGEQEMSADDEKALGRLAERYVFCLFIFFSYCYLLLFLFFSGQKQQNGSRRGR